LPTLRAGGLKSERQLFLPPNTESVWAAGWFVGDGEKARCFSAVQKVAPDVMDGARSRQRVRMIVANESHQGAVDMQIATIGLDIAKNVFQVHGIDAAEKVVVRKQLRRNQVLVFFKVLQPCLVGMEACASAHYWARELTQLGHRVRLMPAKDVKAYVRRNKNDAADAEAICEAVRRPTMRFVQIKAVEQQGQLMWVTIPCGFAHSSRARARGD
jgi:hypothetical protein